MATYKLQTPELGEINNPVSIENTPIIKTKESFNSSIPAIKINISYNPFSASLKGWPWISNFYLKSPKTNQIKKFYYHNITHDVMNDTRILQFKDVDNKIFVYIHAKADAGKID